MKGVGRIGGGDVLARLCEQAEGSGDAQIAQRQLQAPFDVAGLLRLRRLHADEAERRPEALSIAGVERHARN
jgi:lipopolysaccharide biosynthesis regulator YciM